MGGGQHQVAKKQQIKRRTFGLCKSALNGVNIDFKVITY